MDKTQLPQDVDTQSKNEWTSSLFGVFCIILVAILVYVFYASELRQRLENELFDLRTRIKPHRTDSSHVAVVTFSEADIVKIDGPLTKRPTIRTIENVLETVKKSEAEAIVLLLPRQDYDFDDDEMLPIVKWVRHHHNSYIGTYDYNSSEPSERIFPTSLATLDKKALGAGTLRRYRQGVIRRLPILSYTGVELKQHVMLQVALDFASQEVISKIKKHSYDQVVLHKRGLRRRQTDRESVLLPSIRLNYLLPHHFLSVSASSLLQNDADSRLRGRIVLIGYTAYRPRDVSRRDGTHANTPWEGELNPEVQGTPLIYIQAVALNNLLGASWLRRAHLPINILQTAVVAVISFLLWTMSPALAVVLFLLVFAVLIVMHGIAFSYANLFIPMSDTLLFAFFATIAGAFLRARRDSQKVTVKEHKARLQNQLSRLQGRFLNRFSLELDRLNDKIITTMSPFGDQFSGPSTLDRSFRRALTSSFDLKEYLAGIKQITDLGSTELYRVKKTHKHLRPIIEKILLRFEGVLEKKSDLAINVVIEADLTVYSDELILEPIIFNLISNAIKYSPDDGKVEIRAKKVSKARIKISVADNGPGIPNEFRQKIFEKFYRIKNDQVYQIKGNGLGLYLCQYFAMKLESRIEVDSTPGRGSSFWLMVEG